MIFVGLRGKSIIFIFVVILCIIQANAFTELLFSYNYFSLQTVPLEMKDSSFTVI